MVRVWNPSLLLWLDDNRLVAQHAEIHYILAALERKGGIWWKHPETQAFYGHDDILRAIHDNVVSIMTKRHFNHKTPVEGDRAHFHPSERQLAQDVADLYRKWESEGRWTLEGFECGMMKFTGSPRTHTGFHPERPGPRHRVDGLRAELQLMAEEMPHREWTKENREALRPLILEREGHL